MPAAPLLTLALNIPAYRLDVFEDGRHTRSYSVSVGEADHPTPTGEFRVSTITWNPWWIPPASDWAKSERRTPPGPANPMGKVKLEFAPLYYIHGSPERPIGGAASHGCTRMTDADAIDLAQLIHRYGSSALTSEGVQALVADTATRMVQLDRPVALSVKYMIAEVVGESLLVHGDPYGRAVDGRFSAAWRALNAAGYDTSRVDGERLAARLIDAGEKPLTLTIASLLRRR